MRTAPTTPTAIVLFGPPLGICLGVVLVAAIHSALGNPLGPAWAAEVWEMAKMSIVPTIAATAFGAYVRRQNEHALQVLRSVDRVDGPEASGAARPRVRQTGPHRTLVGGRRPMIEAEVMADEEDGPW